MGKTSVGFVPIFATKSMQFFSTPVITLIVGVCVFLVFAKLMKVEKGAAVLLLGAIVLWLVLYFTGYDTTVKRILFHAPPLEHESPFNR